VLLMEALTLEYQDVERLLNCLDGQARLPTAMHSFPLTHAEPPALVLPTGRTLGVLTLASAIREYRIDPQNREPLHGQAPTKPNRRARRGLSREMTRKRCLRDKRSPVQIRAPRLPEKRGLTLILSCVPANNECKAGATGASPQRRGRHAVDAFALPGFNK